jgi:hypothetical protein
MADCWRKLIEAAADFAHSAAFTQAPVSAHIYSARRKVKNGLQTWP